MSIASAMLLLAFPDTRPSDWNDVHADGRCTYGTLDAIAPEYTGPIPAQYYAVCDDRRHLWESSDGRWFYLGPVTTPN